LLRLGDASAVVAAFAVVLSIGPSGRSTTATIATLLATATIGPWAIRFEGLWNPRLTAMRWIELSRLTRAVGLIAVAMLAVDGIATRHVHVGQTAAACALAWVLLVVWRAVHRSWTAHHRRLGRFTQRLIVIGTDQRAIELVRVLDVHPEAGMRVVGLIGSQREARRAGLDQLWLGDLGDAARLVADTPSDGVVVCSADVSPALIDALSDDGGGRELLLHPGLSRIDARRVTASAVAHEALLYVAPATSTGVAPAVKRAVDVIVSATLLFVALPLCAVVAIAIKREDGGPVLFRQRRVGRDDEEFEMLKFRTMVVDAEARRAELLSGNQRSGPLFKLGADPRVTRIGRFLRTTSLDELPQLLNVLRGQMSLVGPRPALRSEVDEFPADLHDRHRVRPGITGLWQVEARDNPAFDAYHRLDLFYVENWSLALDVVIVLGTVEQLLLRPFASRAASASTTAVPMLASAA